MQRKLKKTLGLQFLFKNPWLQIILSTLTFGLASTCVSACKSWIYRVILTRKRVILAHLFFLFVECLEIARAVILSLVWAIRGNIALTWPHFLNNIFSKYSRKKRYNSADCFLWRNNQWLNLRFISCLNVPLQIPADCTTIPHNRFLAYLNLLTYLTWFL